MYDITLFIYYLFCFFGGLYCLTVEEKVLIVERKKHIGNYLSTDIADRNIIADVCDLYQRSNLLISDFRVFDGITLDSLHKIYCTHIYGSEL